MFYIFEKACFRNAMKILTHPILFIFIFVLFALPNRSF